MQRLLLSLAAALAFPIAAVACGGDDGPQTFEVEEVSFEFPGDWEEGEVEDEQFDENQEFSGLVGKPGEDDEDDTDNFIYVSKYILNIEVDEQVLEDQGEALNNEIIALLENDGGVVEDGPEDTEVAGFPALRYEGITEEDGAEFGHHWIFIFNGKDQYFFNCNWDDDGEQEVQDACERALETFEVEE